MHKLKSERTMRQPGGITKDELMQGTCAICNRHTAIYVDDNDDEVCLDCGRQVDAYVRTEGHWSQAQRREAV